MIAPPERSPERDAAIDAVLERVAAQGWTMSALHGALRDIGADPEDAELLFPGGSIDLIEAFIDLTDRRMEADAAEPSLQGLRVPERVRAVIALRLERNRPHKEAVRRAVGVLAWPGNAVLSARCACRTIDAIWHAAGDRAADFSWYTKRATLAGVYSATLLYWLRDDSEEDEPTLAFLDRRLEAVGGVGRLRRRAAEMLRRFRPGSDQVEGGEASGMNA
jgi:ubiquinone biosynthesis protein COQ9